MQSLVISPYFEVFAIFFPPRPRNATWVGVMQEDNSKTDHIPGRIIPVTYFVLYFLFPRKQHISSSEGT